MFFAEYKSIEEYGKRPWTNFFAVSFFAKKKSAFTVCISDLDQRFSTQTASRPVFFLYFFPRPVIKDIQVNLA